MTQAKVSEGSSVCGEVRVAPSEKPRCYACGSTNLAKNRHGEKVCRTCGREQQIR